MEEIKKAYCKSMSLFALVGAILGVILGEYTNLGATYWNLISGPFSESRNKMALRFGLAGLLAGAAIGFLIHWAYSKPPRPGGRDIEG